MGAAAARPARPTAAMGAIILMFVVVVVVCVGREECRVVVLKPRMLEWMRLLMMISKRPVEGWESSSFILEAQA